MLNTATVARRFSKLSITLRVIVCSSMTEGVCGGLAGLCDLSTHTLL
jgi:hypothetical protein